MKKTKLQILGLGVLMAFSSCDLGSDNPAPTPTKPLEIKLSTIEQEIVASEQQNAMKFFAKVAEQEEAKENLMISPFSFNLALSMLSNGAKDKTLTGIEQALGYKPTYRDALNAYQKKMGEAFVNTDRYSARLMIANSLWYRKDLEAKAAFVETLKRYYYAKVQAVDFSQESTADLMNDWTKRATGGLIENFIEKTNPNDIMYLLNTFYFHALWAKGFSFDATKTEEEDFTLADANTVKVATMHQKTKMLYADTPSFSAISLPYGNGAFRLEILLPKADKTIEQLLSTFAEDSSKASPTFTKAIVNLALPRFKFKTHVNCNQILKAMGMEEAYSNTADFTNAFAAASQLSEVKQVTTVEVDEKGTKAAAVTVVNSKMMSAKEVELKEVYFKVNKSFLFTIREQRTASILFVGKVGNPKSN